MNFLRFRKFRKHAPLARGEEFGQFTFVLICGLHVRRAEIVYVAQYTFSDAYAASEQCIVIVRPAALGRTITLATRTLSLEYQTAALLPPAFIFVEILLT